MIHCFNDQAILIGFFFCYKTNVLLKNNLSYFEVQRPKSKSSPNF